MKFPKWLVFLTGIVIGLSVATMGYTVGRTNLSATEYLSGIVEIRIDYSGNKGVNLFGNYTINLLDNGGTSEFHDFEAPLPHTVLLKLRSDAHVAANGATVGNQNLKIKIFRNAVECKYDIIKNYEPGKSCSPPK